MSANFSVEFSNRKHNLDLMDFNWKHFNMISPVHNVSIFVSIVDFGQLSKWSNCCYRVEAVRLLVYFFNEGPGTGLVPYVNVCNKLIRSHF